ncbi:unnamed protein product [Nyctereutes procyonoides]|uniref:(raccoon dog) hypothetical protein n=1 Tax=Nyctereutes procyonoides TaxID=34880 RepID=A0A811ZLQ4_NYCPR|nr:unnamed protein product [Nyctereutes procyonoides]
MKGTFLALFLFSVLLAISEARSEESMKLLWGLEYLKAVVYFCASSRWKVGISLMCFRNTEGTDFTAFLHFSIQEHSAKPPKVGSSGEESLQDGQLPTGGSWGSEKHWVMLKQDL